MARYTRSLTVEAPTDYLRSLLVNTLQSCDFETIYATEEYLMAREIPGQVAFPKLVTVEVLIENTAATEGMTRLNFVIKNEELPLQSNNHCYQMYTLVTQAFEENENWQLVESVAGLQAS